MRAKAKEFLKIIAVCIGGAVFYGIVHDQLTARLCIEYFTVAHPPIIVSDSPTVQGLVWGVIATWWAGALIGIPLAIVARTGAGALWSAQQLKKPVATLLLFMAFGAFISGFAGYVLAQSGIVSMDAGFADAIPRNHHVRFVAAAWAHNASYLLGFLGGAALVFRVWLARCGADLKAGLR